MSENHDKKLQLALDWAVERHEGQWREGPTPLPYAVHPVSVAHLLRHIGGVDDIEMLCAAFLHDLIEETDTTVEEITSAFGDRVAALVSELTRREPTKEEREGLSSEQVWAMRAQMLLDEVGGMSADAQTVKLADRLDNVREAKRTKPNTKLHRYVWQTAKMLEIVPREVNESLWTSIAYEIEEFHPIDMAIKESRSE